MVSEPELSIEEITKSMRIVVDTRCEFVVYSESELKAKEIDLMCSSSYYENVAPMGEVTTAAREQISETRLTGIDFCKYLLELGFEDLPPALSKNETLKIFVKREEHSLTVELDSARRYALSGGFSGLCICRKLEFMPSGAETVP